MRRSERVRRFVSEIWRWYARNKRRLPWRDLPDRDPTMRAYKILVSEVMLQQTQVSRVKIVFKRFLERFPTLQALAQASNRDVLLAWRGMGYNRRALQLREAARCVLRRAGNPKHQIPNSKQIPSTKTCPELVEGSQIPTCGIFPASMEELVNIPGIGPYTAAAIRNFAFHLPTPCLDTNIRRVLHRTFVGPENPDGRWKKDDKYLLRLAGAVLSVALRSERTTNNEKLGTRRAAADWHAALMDFGSLVQTKTRPKWDQCPLTREGLMKAKPHHVVGHGHGHGHGAARARRREPGRLVGARFIPNRIFRGKIVEELRDAPRGLTLGELGKRVCLDWDSSEHRSWLCGLLKALGRDQLLEQRGRRYLLRS